MTDSVASDFSPESLTKICTQIEYWFGNSNLPYDKFLMKFVDNNDGWVPLETLLKFNKLKELKVVSLDPLKTAIKKSKELLILNNTETAVKRATPMPTKDQMIERLSRTIYFKIHPNVDGLDSDLVKKEFVKFGKILMFRFYFKKKLNEQKNDGMVEFSTLEEAEKTQKSLKAFESNPSKSFVLKTMAELEKDKAEEEQKVLLRNFDKKKIFEVTGLPAEMNLHKLRNLLQTAIDEGKTEKRQKGNEHGENEDKKEVPEEQEGKGAEKEKEGEADKQGGASKITEEEKAEMIRKAIGEIKRTPKNIFHIEFFSPPKEEGAPPSKKLATSGEQEEAVMPKPVRSAYVRIDSFSDITSSEVKKSAEMAKLEMGILVFDDEPMAKQKWIESMKAFNSNLAQKKKRRPRRKRRRA